ncbi:MAG: thioredoxin domain-containing protein [Candidatus Woesearchaeota archaeon]
MSEDMDINQDTAEKHNIKRKLINVKHQRKRVIHSQHNARQHNLRQKQNSLLMIIAIILLLVAVAGLLIYIFISKTGVNSATNTLNNQNSLSGISPEIIEFNKRIAGDSPSKGKPDAPVTIIEFIDFQCPFCAKFYREAYKQILTQYVDTGKVKIVFKNFPLPFHENAEKAAKAAECANEQGKFWDMHDKLFENQNALDTDSLKKYAKEISLDTNKFNSCLDSGKYSERIANDLKIGQEIGIQGTPGFLINGRIISGAQPFENFKKIIEQELSGNTSGRAKVELIIVNDENCNTCDSTRVVSALQGLFNGLSKREVDINSNEGKSLIKKYYLEMVPSYLLSSNVVETDAYFQNPQLQSVFQQVSDMYKIRDEVSGATRFIDPVKQAAYEKQLEDQAALQRQKLGIVEGSKKPQIDFFVMSYCPYGNQAEEGIEGAYQILKDKAIFIPRYVIYSNYGGGSSNYCIDSGKYCSMHGIQELNQDIRELCVYNNDGIDAWFKFALAMNTKCNAQNADTCWENVAKDLGLDTVKIKNCQETQGISLSKQQKELNDVLDVSGSPTIFINGESYSGGRAPSDFLAAICAKFDQKPIECNSVVPSTTTTTPTGGCG